MPHPHGKIHHRLPHLPKPIVLAAGRDTSGRSAGTEIESFQVAGEGENDIVKEVGLVELHRKASHERNRLIEMLHHLEITEGTQKRIDRSVKEDFNPVGDAIRFRVLRGDGKKGVEVRRQREKLCQIHADGLGRSATRKSLRMGKGKYIPSLL